jgi:hypothetical protein
MTQHSEEEPTNDQLTTFVDADAVEFYQQSLDVLTTGHVNFLVGGAFALHRYTGIQRHTKDFDLFVMPHDTRDALEKLRPICDRVELTYPHWLAKAKYKALVIDLIFGSGNGLCPVDEAWFEHATADAVFNREVLLIPVEEMIWQKSFIMERHRFDGGDVAHLLHARSEQIDWDRLFLRFGERHWPVLYVHLILTEYIYPRDLAPALRSAIDELRERMAAAAHRLPNGYHSADVCQGTFLSLLDYLPEVTRQGYRDARLAPIGNMTQAEINHWTANFER